LALINFYCGCFVPIFVGNYIYFVVSGSQNNIVFTIDSTCNIKQQNIYNYQQKLEQNIHNKNLLKPILSQMNGLANEILSISLLTLRV
jgi:hypothetical protein